MSESFKNKTVIVTGGGKGIGKSIALAFATAGANVMIATRTVSSGQDVVDQIVDHGGVASVNGVDVKNKQELKNMVAETVRLYGSVDVVVHCAAQIPHGTISDISDETIDDGLNSILKASVWLTQATKPYLEKAIDGGRLIFISSVCGTKTVLPGLAIYAAAKAGLDAFVRSAALELAHLNITVNGITPGLIASDNALRAGEEALKAYAKAIPVPRPGKPSEVAHVALFLASADSSYITGDSIVIDGGSTLSKSDPSALLN